MFGQDLGKLSATMMIIDGELRNIKAIKRHKYRCTCSGIGDSGSIHSKGARGSVWKDTTFNISLPQVAQYVLDRALNKSSFPELAVVQIEGRRFNNTLVLPTGRQFSCLNRPSVIVVQFDGVQGFEETKYGCPRTCMLWES